MNRHTLLGVVVSATTLVMVSNPAGQAVGRAARQVSAQQGSLPRAPVGHPSFEGVSGYGTSTPLERPAQFASRPYFMNDAEAEQFRKEAESTRRAVEASRLGVPEFVEENRPFVTIAGR